MNNDSRKYSSSVMLSVLIEDFNDSNDAASSWDMSISNMGVSKVKKNSCAWRKISNYSDIFYGVGQSIPSFLVPKKRQKK